LVGLWRLTHDAMSFDSAKTLTDLVAGDRTYQYYSLDGAGNTALGDVSRLPYTLKIILENLIRRHAGQPSSRDRLEEMIVSVAANRVGCDVEFWPVRVMMDDTAGIPLIGDLAAMREEAARRCGDPQRINPVVPVDFIVDHSIMADHAASPAALARNAELEFNRNQERFRFLRWGAHALTNLRVVPPGNGICHQINLEYLARVVCLRDDGKRTIAYPDSMIGIDSHTPMINGLGVVGWGVSGLEGVAAA
jgi:aconitate hydratase A / 2-methylisocitrate dehydratase